MACSTRKTVLVWDINTITHLLRITPRQQKKAEAAVAAISRTAHTTSLRKWRKILGLLRSITPAVAGSRIMFTRVQHSIQKEAGQNVHLTADVQYELEAWRKIVCSLASRPTHLRELQLFPPTWIGTTDTLGYVMGGVFQDPEGQYFVWSYPFSLATRARLVSSSNPNGDVKINNLDLGELPMQLLLFATRMAPSAHIHTYINNMAAQEWTNQ